MVDRGGIGVVGLGLWKHSGSRANFGGFAWWVKWVCLVFPVVAL